MLTILRGLGIPPWAVATARGFVEAVLMAGLVAAGVYVTNDARLIGAAPVVLFALRWLEGIVDQIDPEKKSAP